LRLGRLQSRGVCHIDTQVQQTGERSNDTPRRMGVSMVFVPGVSLEGRVEEAD
jgi:hypothetical protein